MARYDQEFLDQLERMIGEVESETSAELVVVLAPRSDGYLDVPYKIGALMALAMFGASALLPVPLKAGWMLLDVIAAFAVGYGLGKVSGTLLRLFTCKIRRGRLVRRAAESVFTSRNLSLTKDRTGLLLYVSWMERKVELIADVGIENKIPVAVFQQMVRQVCDAFGMRDLPGEFEQAFQILRPTLKAYLPPSIDNPNEVPNRPVVL